MNGYSLNAPRPYCKLCGVVPENALQHRLFHEYLENLVHHVIAPHLSDEQWKAKLNSPEFQTFLSISREQKVRNIEMETDKVMEDAVTQISNEQNVTDGLPTI